MKITPQKISKAVNISFGKFDHFRRARSKFMAQTVGRFYHNSSSAGEDRKAAPLNLLHSAYTTLIPNLVYNRPKMLVSTDILPYRNYADLLRLALNHLVGKIDLRMTLRKCIADAVFMAGFIKTGIAAGEDVCCIEGSDIELGSPYAERVDPDDIILDPMARDWDEQAFIGNRYRADLDELLETGMYDPDELQKLNSRYVTGQAGEAEKMSGDKGMEFNEIVRYVDLVDVYLPKQKIVVTLPYQKDAAQENFLRVADYAGPARGPYHMLGFTPVSDNILPVAPAGIWYDLHILGNRIARKLARQAERMKQVLAYQGEAVEDVKGIVDADDGETVKVEDIDKIKEVKFGGAATDSYAWMEWVKRHFSEQAGSIDMLSGTGSNVPTATQAEMLQANTSVRLGDMQNMVYSFASDVASDLMYHLHTDPLIELPLAKRVEGTEQQVFFTPETRQGEWADFNLEVKPYSMARPDPNTSVRRKLEFATNVIPAAAQAVAILGPGFKIGPFLRRMAEEVGIEDADEFLDDPAFTAYIMQRLQMNTGDPGKAGPYINMPQLGMGGPVNPNPNQPNPMAKGPTGGITPDTEQAMAQQETAGDLQAGQSGRVQPSARSMAMSRG
jgi:hypothetical protein